MARPGFHPNAYLGKIRNVRQGLTSRTKILQVLERGNLTASALAKESKLSYSVVLHHLRLLEDEEIVVRRGQKKPYFWKMTGVGQQRLRPD